MLCLCYVNITFSLYSIFVVLLNVNPIATLKGLDLAKSVRHNGGRKKETYVSDRVIEFADAEDEVLAESGETVTLRCAVKNLENDIVSWIRCRNLRVITSGSIVFAADRRFQLNTSASDESEWWNLTINNVQSNDSGIYECQVNTEPKLKRFVLLIVNSEYEVEELQHITQDAPMNFRAAVTANIFGPPEQFIRVGDTVTLTCYISFKQNDDAATETDSSLSQQDVQSVRHSESFFRKVHWFHSSNLISVKRSGQHVNINTENHSPFLTVSRLTISHAQSQDAGSYLCKPIGGPISGVILSVIKGLIQKFRTHESLTDCEKWFLVYRVLV